MIPKNPELPDWNADCADSFSRFADQAFLPLYPYILQDVETALNGSVEGLRVLEIGGGPGHMGEIFLRSSVLHLVEVDVSLHMLEKAGERFVRVVPNRGNWYLCQGCVSRLPVSSALFDLVFSRGSAQFWPDMPQALKEIRRVLVPGGAAYIGGGYGLSTPPGLKSWVAAEREKRDMEQKEKKKPYFEHLDYRKMLALAEELGGMARLLGSSPGGWLFWKPYDNNREIEG